jgi:Tfp pilus assembly protein PilX
MTKLTRHLSSRLRDERGMALMLAIALTTILGATSITVVQVVQSEQSRSTQAVKRDASFQAAEAGIDEYIAKLLDDGTYDIHNVHPGESTRRSTSGVVVSPTCTGAPPTCSATPWNYGATWTYPNGKDKWRTLANGYEYNIEVRPPTQGSNGAVSILSTGRPAGSTDQRTWRALFGQVRPAGVADFQMIADSNITYGSTATTYGKIYAARDASGVAHSVRHDGDAYADIYAEGSITGAVTMYNGAKKYPSSTVRSVIPTPINFASFLASISAIQTASLPANGGLNFNASGKVWRLTFGSAGNVAVQSCSPVGTDNPAKTNPTSCSTVSGSPFNLPSNGAIYTGQTAIVSGTVNGRVTVASAGDIVVGGPIYYNDKRAGCSSGGSPTGPADDVLGLDAMDTMYIAQWLPSVTNATLTNYSWCAATISQNGTWESYTSNPIPTPRSQGGPTCNDPCSTMTFTGSTATEGGGQMGMFQYRHYNYDPALVWIQPPWFPVIAGMYTVYSKHELKASFGF